MNELSASSRITYRAVMVRPGMARRIRGLSDKTLAGKLKERRKSMRDKVLAADAKVRT